MLIKGCYKLLNSVCDAINGISCCLEGLHTHQECIFNAFKEVVYVVKGLNQGGFAWLNVTVHAGVIGANRTQLLVAKTHMHVQQNVDSCSIVVFMKLN